MPYTILDSQGEVVTNGLLDDIARTPRIYRETEDALKVLVGKCTDFRLGLIGNE